MSRMAEHAAVNPAHESRALVLASASPRRSALLTEAGFAHRVESPTIDDADLAQGNVAPEQWVASLAYLKARNVFDRLRANHEHDILVVGADTVVVKNGEVIGQPKDEDEARRILRTLRNGEHSVITGVALLADGSVRRLFTDAASVRVGDVTDEMIERYVSTWSWRGKAGGYNLRERIDDGWPIEFEGDASTVMGLPMRRLTPLLRKWLAPALAHEGAT